MIGFPLAVVQHAFAASSIIGWEDVKEEVIFQTLLEQRFWRAWVKDGGGHFVDVNTTRVRMVKVGEERGTVGQWDLLQRLKQEYSVSRLISTRE